MYYSLFLLLYHLQELRVQDYMQNRKSAAATSAFGNSAFGAAQPATANIFGQPAQQTSTLFGGTSNTNTGTANGFGAFGQPSSTNTTPAFGGGTFGQTQPQQQSAFGTTGGFGLGQQPQQQNSVFGGGTTSGFGNAGNKPAFGTFGGRSQLRWRPFFCLNIWQLAQLVDLELARP